MFRKVLSAIICGASVMLVSTHGASNALSESVGTVRIAPPTPAVSDAERQSELARRRAFVAEKMAQNSVLVLMSAEPRIYSNDVDFLYRQENNLFYLTNLAQTNAMLVMVKTPNGVKEMVFAPPRNPVSETWNGKMYSVEEVRRISGIQTVVSSREVDKFLSALKSKNTFESGALTQDFSSIANLYLLLSKGESDRRGEREYRRENELAKSLETDAAKWKIENAHNIFGAARLIKSPLEIKLLQHAIDITTEAQMRSMAVVGRSNFEYEVQAEVEYTFRRRNADYWGYPSIVGCGANATTLHYVESQGAIGKNDLLLMDVGAEYQHYTADVTRTFPVSGKFTKEQAEIYQIVYDAQEAAARELKPDSTFSAASRAASVEVEKGLYKLGLITEIGGLIPGTAHEVSDGKGGTRQVGVPQYSLWFMHGWGHWLGMNVHDVGEYSGKLRPGMVTTNEPGIYIRADALENLPQTNELKTFIEKIRPAFEKYKNIGVRIEDDMLITENGVRWMTANLPRSIQDIENFMAKASKKPLTSNWRHFDESKFALALESKESFIDDLINETVFDSAKNGVTVRRGWKIVGKIEDFAGHRHEAE